MKSRLLRVSSLYSGKFLKQQAWALRWSSRLKARSETSNAFNSDIRPPSSKNFLLFSLNLCSQHIVLKSTSSKTFSNVLKSIVFHMFQKHLIEMNYKLQIWDHLVSKRAEMSLEVARGSESVRRILDWSKADQVECQSRTSSSACNH